MRREKKRWLRRPWMVALLLLQGVTGIAWAASSAVDAWTAVAERSVPIGLVRSPAEVVRQLAGGPQEARAVSVFEARVRADWEFLRTIDLYELSRWHRDETQGFRLASQPGQLEGEVIGLDASGRLTVRVLGPALPVRFTAAERHVAFYGLYDPQLDRLTHLTATIHLEVFE